MMFEHAIQRAVLAYLALAVAVGGAQASPFLMADGGPPAAGRMSTSLSLSALPVTRTAPVVNAAPAMNAEPAMKAPMMDEPPGAGIVPSRGAIGEPRFDLKVKNAPATQVFMQMGVGTRYNMLVPPDLEGNVTLNLRSVTVPEALEVLREMFGYEYRITGNRVFVSGNAIQTRLFRINYLPGRRLGSSELSISSTSASSNGGTSSSSNSNSASSASGSDASSGSGSSSSRASGTNTTSSVQTSTDTDFWRDVKLSLATLIGSEAGRSVTLNPAAGVIVVRATPAELRQVADYLRAVQITIERQVMLEAKIVEVRLNEGSETGINWGLFRTGSNGGQTGLIGMAPGVSLTSSNTNANINVTPGTGLVTAATGKGFYGLSVSAPNFSALLSFLETQGDVQVLSSPRVAALNNQKAVLKVGRDETFVTEVASNTTSSTTSTTSSPTVKTGNFFSGISLDVTPQIDENGVVMLHVHPAISSASQKDLSVTIEGKQSTFPGVTVSINETDSVVRVSDGQIVALGGLMEMEGSNGESGVPGLRRAPMVGNLFNYKTRSVKKRELVILIKPTVLNLDGTGADASMPATAMLDGR